MKLPFVDEVRDARQATEESATAMGQVHKIGALLTSLDVIERQLGVRPDITADLPGADLIEEVAEGWSALADLTSSSPRPDEQLAMAIATRRSQLHLALQVLRPLADESTARGQALHAFQHQQRHALQAATYAGAVRELADLGGERDRLAATIQPLNQRLAMVDPALAVLRRFVDRLLEEHTTSGDLADPHGIRSWRAGQLATNLITGLGAVIAAVELDIPLPNPPELPEEPNPTRSKGIWVEVHRVQGQLAELHAILEEEGSTLRADRDAQQERHEQVTRSILDRMG
jgi:hypothetical protein